jgi:hypothetical protein
MQYLYCLCSKANRPSSDCSWPKPVWSLCTNTSFGALSYLQHHLLLSSFSTFCFCEYAFSKIMSSSIQFHSLETDDDAFRLTAPPSGWKPFRNTYTSSSTFSTKCLYVCALILSSALTFMFSLTALLVSTDSWHHIQQQTDMKNIQSGLVISPSRFKPTSRIAFGSCTSYDLRPQPVWKSVVASGPDAWIWLGDMAYTDSPLVDCA